METPRKLLAYLTGLLIAGGEAVFGEGPEGSKGIGYRNTDLERIAPTTIDGLNAVTRSSANTLVADEEFGNRPVRVHRRWFPKVLLAAKNGAEKGRRFGTRKKG